MFRATYTALVTPFRNDKVDLDAFDRLIETQINAGITGIIAVGTTGESPTLSHEEKRAVIARAVKTAAKRCQVLAGTGTSSTRDTIEATKEGAELGIDGALIVAPYYNKPNQEGLFRHFEAVAQKTSLPIMLYNIPGRSGVDIGVETVVRLARACGNIVSIKEASGSVDRARELKAALPNEFTILSGDDGLTFPFMEVGAVGVVSVASNLIPHEMVELVGAFVGGDRDGARTRHEKLLPLFKALFLEPNPVPAKTALSWQKMMSAEVRLPLCEMSEENLRILREVVDRLGIGATK